jgi:hypothetical protein
MLVAHDFVSNGQNSIQGIIENNRFRISNSWRFHLPKAAALQNAVLVSKGV